MAAQHLVHLGQLAQQTVLLHTIDPSKIPVFSQGTPVPSPDSVLFIIYLFAINVHSKKKYINGHSNIFSIEDFRKPLLFAGFISVFNKFSSLKLCDFHELTKDGLIFSELELQYKYSDK